MMVFIPAGEYDIGSPVDEDGHGDDAGLVVRTHLASDGALRRTVDGLRGLDVVKRVVGVMRVEGEAGA